MPTFRLTIAYDGTDFAGSQIQPSQRTVQGVLEDVLGGISDCPARTIFAGRTDRGVHAVGQVVAAQLPAWKSDDSGLERALHATLPPDIAATRVIRCQDTFNPRFAAVWREYRYWIAAANTNPFLRRYAWATRSEVAASQVAEAARSLLGTHDFASFASGGEGVPWSERALRPRGSVRTVLRCDCRDITVNAGPSAKLLANVLEIRVAADGFLPRMVRNIVGALVEVGQGRRKPEWIGEILVARDRRSASQTAPAHGVTLWDVGFAGDELEDWELR